MSGTKINDLVANSGQKSNEDSMVDSSLMNLIMMEMDKHATTANASANRTRKEKC